MRNGRWQPPGSSQGGGDGEVRRERFRVRAAASQPPARGAPDHSLWLLLRVLTRSFDRFHPLPFGGPSADGDVRWFPWSVRA
jgi:hypothetical protein